MTTITIDRATVEQALEALENAEDQLAKPYSTDASKAVVALRAALAQQAEPVKFWPLAPLTGYYDVGGRRVWLEKDDPFPVPAPPQRKPLTDEEIAAEWRKASECAGKSEGAVTTSQFVQMFARAVERAHGIGGSDE